MTACFEVAAEKRKELATAALAEAATTRVALRTKTESFPESISVRGFEEVEKDGKRVATDKPKEYVARLRRAGRADRDSADSPSRT